MKNIEELKERLIEEESLELKPYKCSAGKLTIGVGRNLEDRGISKGEAMFMLRNDIIAVASELAEKSNIFRTAPIEVRMILIDMGFNMGVPRLLQFKKTFQYIKEGDFKSASVEMLDSQWAGQVPARANGLSELMAEVQNV